MIDDSTTSAEPARAHEIVDYPPPPEMGDVIDALDDAAASLKVVVRNQTKSLVGEIKQFVRQKPMAALAFVGAVAYLVGRLRR